MPAAESVLPMCFPARDLENEAKIIAIQIIDFARSYGGRDRD